MRPTPPTPRARSFSTSTAKRGTRSCSRPFGVPAAVLPRGRAQRRPISASTEPHLFGARHPRRGHGRRPAGGEHRPGLPLARHDQGDLRHRRFILLNTGGEALASRHRLLTTIAYRLPVARSNYALEGSIFVAGAAMQWLRDGSALHRATPARAKGSLAALDDNRGVYLVPAFTGLGAPLLGAGRAGCPARPHARHRQPPRSCARRSRPSAYQTHDLHGGDGGGRRQER